MAEGSEHWATSGEALIGAIMGMDFHYVDSAHITFVEMPTSSGQLQKSTKLQMHLGLTLTGWS